MSANVYGVTEVVGTSPDGVDAAIEVGIARASTTLRGLDWFEVTEVRGHINEGRVFPVTYSVGDTLEGYTTIRKLADSVDHIIPGHDPQVLDRYPAAAPGLETLVVRRDVDPTK